MCTDPYIKYINSCLLRIVMLCYFNLKIKMFATTICFLVSRELGSPKYILVYSQGQESRLKFEWYFIIYVEVIMLSFFFSKNKNKKINYAFFK